MKIGNIEISIKKKPILISEISGNHGGKLSNAMKLIREAAKNGSDLIKLQTYNPKKLTLDSDNPEFIIKDKKSIWKKRKLFDLYSEGQTPREWHYKLFEEAKKYNIKCFTSIFDEDDIEFLEKLKVPAYKIASFESTHFPLIEKVIKTKKPILISTGLNNYKEIQELVRFLKKKNCKKFALLKCTSSYPAKLDSLNLSLISDMRKKFKCEIGYSDHSLGYTAAIGSIHYGASFIEKHICLNKSIGIDAKFSLEVKNIFDFKNYLIDAYETKGKIIYGPTKDEKNYLKFRRSIYTSKDILKNEKFTKKNLVIIRPSLGLEPKNIKKIIGKRAKCKIKFATPLKWKYIK
jgi:pseudaminic acid synthase